MRFIFTMNMPSFNGHLVHQIIGEHSAETLEDLMDLMENSDFITVVEVYKDTDSRSSSYYTKGPIMLNCMHIGKVKEFVA